MGLEVSGHGSAARTRTHRVCKSVLARARRRTIGKMTRFADKNRQPIEASSVR